MSTVRPSSSTCLTAGWSTCHRTSYTSTPDPATHFWVSVAVHMQRRLATRLHETIQDGLVADRTGNVAFQTVLEPLGRWSRRPLDLE